MDTIYALATAPGKAGVSVIRVSGPLAYSAASKLCGQLPQPRYVSKRTITDLDDKPIDEALILCFREGASFTGEAAREFHLHGSIAVV